ncbi:hypothetical protein DFP72DRAFT_1049961 [Ephemerocybe angulata]|uniref:Fungal-type protein kinase domain-containing protein n=1 Tax=Ephemerocybe angulata TaxID=980116 RepID=A0A8H6HJH4_9AGAR|nr:hypothetical protein DFP72DRAFT_1049961 [Tulosesus angulatus]
MLRAMIMLKNFREDKSDTTPTTEELWEYGNKEIHTLVEAAVLFCKDQTRSLNLAVKLDEIAKSKSEAGRYRPLATGINSILLDFHKRKIGGLEGGLEKDLTLYDVGANLVIDMNRSKRKPDVYESRYEDLLRLTPEFKKHSFKQLADLMEDDPETWSAFSSDRAKSGITKWSDLITCIEVKKIKGPGSWNKLPRQKWEKGEYSARELLRQENFTCSEPDTSPPTAGQGTASAVPVASRKRRGKASKKGKAAGRTDMNTTALGPLHTGALSPDVQCAFYALELMRARWDKTHSIVMLLSGKCFLSFERLDTADARFTDDNFSVNWYDSQGCIATRPISLFGNELPLFVATIILFQRFRDPMRGRASLQLKATICGRVVPFDIPEDTNARCELRGRRPVTAVPVAPGHAGLPQGSNPARTLATRTHPDTSANAPLEELFFKSYWRETSRDAEKDILDTAKARARQHLPPEHVGDVLNHLPEIYHSEDRNELSTLHIRLFANLNGGDPRVLCLMMSKRLLSMEETFDVQEVEEKVWEILRCLCLLWALGIAHCDVTFDNIMAVEGAEGGKKYMVLNDFDLAGVMNPGDESPPRKGHERTGTKPFMALDYMGHPDGSIPHVLRHDIEATLWSMAWYSYDRDRKWSWDVGSLLLVSQTKEWWLSHLTGPVSEQVENEHIDPKFAHLWGAVVSALKDEFVASMDTGYDPHNPDFMPSVPRQGKDFLMQCEKYLPRKDQFKTWPWMDFAVKEPHGY